MNTFNRGLDCEFIDALNREYKEGGWWRRLVDDPELFIAIRENYLNVYYRGCGLAKLNWKSGQIVGEIHYKYLLRPSGPKEYVSIRNGNITLNGQESLFVVSLNDIADIKKAAEPYAGQEKNGVHSILAANPNVIDVEIAFGISGASEDDSSAPRIDFAAIQPLSDREGMKLTFFEAKHFSNKSALRASDSKDPKVVGQISNYRHIIRERADDIARGYRQVCCDLPNLIGMMKQYPGHETMLKSIANGSTDLIVDETPILVVFGFDNDQKGGTSWAPHREKLGYRLGKDKVLFRGEADEFKRGISV